MELLEVGAVGVCEREPVDDDARRLVAGRDVEVLAAGVDGQAQDGPCPRTGKARVDEPSLRDATAGWNPPDDR